MKQVVQRRFQHLVLKKRQCGIENFLSEAQDYTNSEININEIFESAVKGNVNNKSFFYKILNKLFSETIEAIKSIGIVIIIIIISSILKNITEDLDNKGIQNLTHYVTYILIVTVVMHNFSDIINMCKTSISNLVDFINSLKNTFPEFDILAENDATVAGLAESRFGSAKNSSSSVLITLGTGVGGGIVINGRPFSGAHGVGSEIGHMIIGENFYDCNCGNNGCFETFCSATAIIKYAQKLLSEENAPTSAILDMCKGDISKIDAKIVFDAYRQDDQIAKEVIARFKKYLAIGIANIVNTLDPEVVAIGGGLSKSSDIILDGLKEMVREHITYKDEEFADILIATLGNDAGIIGASILK